jgi:hypothetical protein
VRINDCLLEERLKYVVGRLLAVLVAGMIGMILRACLRTEGLLKLLYDSSWKEINYFVNGNNFHCNGAFTVIIV